MYAIVKKGKREWKKRCVINFISQLLSNIPTNERATLTPPFLRSLIASLPRDDNWKIIPVITVTAVKVPKGEEGAEILITKI